jgi:hypothetical protein
MQQQHLDEQGQQIELQYEQVIRCLVLIWQQYLPN